MKLIIANKNYSSWSLRGWLMVHGFGLEAEEQVLPLFTDEFYSELSKYSSAAKVPVLVDGEIVVWDSLAICEYINEQHIEGKGWPAIAGERAKARSLAAEMHSGFPALRNEMPMNCRAKRRIEASESCLADIARIDQIWSEQRRDYQGKGDWLFGQFSIVDCMFAPVVMRFATYGVSLSPRAQEYADSVLGSTPIKHWLDEAALDKSFVEEDEAGVEK